MEEYIKQVEDIISFLDDVILYADSDDYDMKKAQKDKMALKYLLKRYKELEEENKASKETINILTNKSEKVVDENNISEEEKRVLEAYRNYKEISGSNSWIICNPNTMWSEYFIPISVIQNKIDELKHRKSKNEFEFACKLKGILYLQELLEERKNKMVRLEIGRKATKSENKK